MMNIPLLSKNLSDKELRLEVIKGKVDSRVEEARILKDQIKLLKE